MVTDRSNGPVQHLIKSIAISIHLQHHIHRAAIEQDRQTNAVHHGRLQVIGNQWHWREKGVSLPRKNPPDGFADIANRNRRKFFNRIQHGVLIGVTGDHGNPAAFQIGQGSNGSIASTDEQAVSEGHQRIGKTFSGHHWHSGHPGGQNGIGCQLALNRAGFLHGSQNDRLHGDSKLIRQPGEVINVSSGQNTVTGIKNQRHLVTPQANAKTLLVFQPVQLLLAEYGRRRCLWRFRPYRGLKQHQQAA